MATIKIGNQTIGGSSNNLNHNPASGVNVAALKVRAPSGFNTTVDSISGYFSGSGSNQLAIWDSSGNLVANSAIAITVSGTGWVTATYSGTKPVLTAGATYYIGYTSGSLSTNYFAGSFSGTGAGTNGYVGHTTTDSVATNISDLSTNPGTNLGQGTDFCFYVSATVSSSLLDSMLAYYKFDADSSIDYFGSNDGTDNGMAYGASNGKIGHGASFAGSSNSDNFTLPSTLYNMLTGTQPFTINLWIRFTSLPTVNGSQLFNLFNSTADYHAEAVRLWINPASDYTILAYRSDGTTLDTIQGASALSSTGVWYMITLTYDGSNLKIYKNATSDATAVASTRTTTSATGAIVGDERSGGTISSNSKFVGDMDELAFWSRALTTTEITALYNSGSGNQYPFSQTYTKSIAATVAGTPSILRPATFLKALQSTVSGVAHYLAVATRNRSIVATVTGTPSVLRPATLNRAFQATVSGVAHVLYPKTILKAIAATATGVAVNTFGKAYVKMLQATATATASVSFLRVKVISIVATAVSSTSIARQSAYLRSIVATAQAQPTIGKGLTLSRALVATATASVAIGMGRQLSRTLVAVAQANPSVAKRLNISMAIRAIATATTRIAEFYGYIEKYGAEYPTTYLDEKYPEDYPNQYQ